MVGWHTRAAKHCPAQALAIACSPPAIPQPLAAHPATAPPPCVQLTALRLDLPYTAPPCPLACLRRLRRLEMFQRPALAWAGQGAFSQATQLREVLVKEGLAMVMSLDGPPATTSPHLQTALAEQLAALPRLILALVDGLPPAGQAADWQPPGLEAEAWDSPGP